MENINCAWDLPGNFSRSFFCPTLRAQYYSSRTDDKQGATAISNQLDPKHKSTAPELLGLPEFFWCNAASFLLVVWIRKQD